MNYHIVRTDTADAGIRKIILYIAQNFGNDVALQKLDEMEQNLLSLGDNPYIGTSHIKAAGIQSSDSRKKPGLLQN